MVNCATRWIGLILMITLLAPSVAGQDMPLPDPDGLDLPFDSSMPSEFEGVPLPDVENLPQPTENEAPSRLVAPPQSRQMPTSVQAPTSGGRDSSGYMTDSFADDMGGSQVDEFESYAWDGQPAPVVSSGTWLDRGVWYAEADAMFLYRIWQKVSTFVAADDQTVIIPPDPTNVATLFPSAGLFLNTNRKLYIPATHPGADAGVRTTLGRFLFRDDENRDHTAEFTAWAAGNWVSDNAVSSASPNRLFVSFRVDGGNALFDQSSFQRVIYSSRLNNFELNYRMKKRLGRDQMVMDPNGNWRREANNGFIRTYLAGFRYVQVDESLNWTAEDIAVAGADGQYLIDTTNDLFGFQVGQGLRYESGRWSAEVSGKMGLFWNNAESHQQMNLTASDEDDFNRDVSQAELSWIGEGEVLGRYHITPNASLRAGLEFMVLDSLALAPRQINFINDSNWIETGGNPWYIGGLLGFEFYW